MTAMQAVTVITVQKDTPGTLPVKKKAESVKGSTATGMENASNQLRDAHATQDMTVNSVMSVWKVMKDILIVFTNYVSPVILDAEEMSLLFVMQMEQNL